MSIGMIMQKQSTEATQCKIWGCLCRPCEDIETRFDTFNYEAERPLPINKNETVIGLI